MRFPLLDLAPAPEWLEKKRGSLRRSVPAAEIAKVDLESALQNYGTADPG
jgi:hypothetical protein